MTIGMMVVPESEIHQFGAGITDSDGRIVEWEEKPKVPRTNLASMGIYVFNTDYLLKMLARDRNETDFGMHIIPSALERDRVYAYPFTGYWRDVGTVQAYWEANMDCIRGEGGIVPQQWGIRPNPEAEGLPADRCPSRFLPGAKVQGSLIAAGCRIEGEVVNSVLSPGVHVGPGAVVRDSILFADCRIGAGAEVDLVVMDKKVRVGEGARIGCGERQAEANREFPKHLYTGITLVGKGAAVPAKARIGRNCIIDPYRREEEFPGQELGSGSTL